MQLLATRKIDELKQVIEQFQHNLMWLEMQLVEQLDVSVVIGSCIVLMPYDVVFKGGVQRF